VLRQRGGPAADIGDGGELVGGSGDIGERAQQLDGLQARILITSRPGQRPGQRLCRAAVGQGQAVRALDRSGADGPGDRAGQARGDQPHGGTGIALPGQRHDEFAERVSVIAPEPGQHVTVGHPRRGRVMQPVRPGDPGCDTGRGSDQAQPAIPGAGQHPGRDACRARRIEYRQRLRTAALIVGPVSAFQRSPSSPARGRGARHCVSAHTALARTSSSRSPSSGASTPIWAARASRALPGVSGPRSSSPWPMQPSNMSILAEPMPAAAILARNATAYGVAG